MERNELLDHIFWHTLAGAHRRHSSGTDLARRYTEGFSPIIAFADPARPDFAALAPWCAAGEHFYCENWSGTAPSGWRIDAETTMFRMVWSGTAPAADPAPEVGQPAAETKAKPAVKLDQAELEKEFEKSMSGCVLVGRVGVAVVVP